MTRRTPRARTNRTPARATRNVRRRRDGLDDTPTVSILASWLEQRNWRRAAARSTGRRRPARSAVGGPVRDRRVGAGAAPGRAPCRAPAARGGLAEPVAH